MKLEIIVDKGELRISPGVGERRRLAASDRTQLSALAQAYRQRLGKSGKHSQLLQLGQQLYQWLDGADHWLQQRRDTWLPPYELEICAPLNPSAAEWAVLQAPWELLADSNHFLAENAQLSFSPVRRLGKAIPPPALSPYRLGLTFMAGAPRGAQELAYEAEENAILDATHNSGGMDLVVEDSGNPELLASRLGELADMPILHLSCHGDNAYRAHPESSPQPVLLLEDDEGNALPTAAASLVQTLGAQKPRLLVLSACLSAAQPEEENPALADSLATALVRAGVPAVLAWEGSVYDHEAIDFAEALYRALGHRNPLAQAVGSARAQLLHNGSQGQASRDWHLARLWCGPAGGGLLVGGKQKRQLVSADRGFKEFLDKRTHRSPVASREAFVGRRRELQNGLRQLRADHQAGLLIHGMGRLGKSSLAARLANRLGGTYAIAVVFEYYDASSVFESIYEAVKSDPKARTLLESARSRLLDDPLQLEGILLDLLTGPCAQQTEAGLPLLLIIDDLERILEAPQAGSQQPHRVVADAVVSLRAILRAFQPARSDSRLILTSRYRFTLPDRSADGDLASRLYSLHLPPLPESTRRKLSLRQRQQLSRQSQPISAAELAAQQRLVQRAEQVGRGNPGLQELLSGLIFAPGASAAKSGQTLDEMEAYLAGQRGSTPNEEQIQAFLKDLALEKLIELARPAARELLRNSGLFAQPVPHPVLSLIGEDQAISELQSLGLLDQFEDLVNPTQAAFKLNELVQAKAGQLRNSEKAALAKGVLTQLFGIWGGAAGQDRPAAANLQLTQLGLLAQDTAVLQTCAAAALAGLQAREAYRQAAALGRQVIETLDQAGQQPPAQLLRFTGECCITIGEVAQAADYYARGLQALDQIQDRTEREQFNRAVLMQMQARMLVDKGQVDEALELYQAALEVYQALGDERSRAVTLGDIARIMRNKGQVDEALKLHQERLEVYQTLGDERSRAITLGDIARIRVNKGQVDEALELHQEELEVFQALGDERGRAITLGDIAQIRVNKGQVDEALELHQAALEVFQAQGDERSRAITLRDIARIMKAKGQVDEALELHQAALDVYQALGDQRERAITLGDIAQIMRNKGQIDEALELHQAALEVFQALGDERSRAVTLGDIAQIMRNKGEVDEALKLHQERLEIVEALGDLEVQASVLWDMGSIALNRNEIQAAAPKIAKAYQLFMQIGRLDAICVVGSTYGQLLYASGRREDSLTVLHRSAEGYRQLGQEAQAQNIEALIAKIDQAGSGNTEQPRR